MTVLSARVPPGTFETVRDVFARESGLYLTEIKDSAGFADLSLIAAMACALDDMLEPDCKPYAAECWQKALTAAGLA